MPTDTPPWLTGERETWLASIVDWARAAAASTRGTTIDGIASVKERPWGAVLRATTGTGPLYIKAVGPRGGQELPLLVDLSERAPGLGPDVLALDEQRGWLLLADHGSAVRSLPLADQLAVVESLLPAYAAMQLATVDLVDTWIAAGVPDRTVERIPALVATVLRGDGPLGHLPIEDDERRRLFAALDELAHVCDVLASTTVDRGLDHADIHGTNVVVDGDQARLLDWGDACVSHPWTSLFVPLQFFVAALDVSQRRAAALRLRDAYLDAWGPVDPNLLGLAVWIGHVTRVLNFDTQLVGASGELLRDSQHEAAALLRAWLAKLPLLDDPVALLVPQDPPGPR